MSFEWLLREARTVDRGPIEGRPYFVILEWTFRLRGTIHDESIFVLLVATCQWIILQTMITWLIWEIVGFQELLSRHSQQISFSVISLLYVQSPITVGVFPKLFSDVSTLFLLVLNSTPFRKSLRVSHLLDLQNGNTSGSDGRKSAALQSVSSSRISWMKRLPKCCMNWKVVKKKTRIRHNQIAQDNNVGLCLSS